MSQKTYKQMVGESLIKVGLGFLGGGFYSALIKTSDYIFLVLALLIGILSIHFGAKLSAQEKKNDD